MVVTVTESVAGSGWATQCPKTNRGAPDAEGWDTPGEKEAVGAIVRVGETVKAVSSRVAEGWGSSANWAIADRERVRTGLQQERRG